MTPHWRHRLPRCRVRTYTHARYGWPVDVQVPTIWGRLLLLVEMWRRPR